MSRTIVLLTVLCAVALSATARTLRVPQEYGSIQAALNALAAQDTVLVGLGEYAESLYAPPLPFVLRGDVLPDTGDYARPVINPSALPGSDTLACLTLPDTAAVVLEDLVFRNDWRMYPRGYPAASGIRSYCHDLTVRRCVFDSLSYAIKHLPTDTLAVMRVEQCQFIKIVETAIWPGSARALVRDCLLSGNGLLGLARGGLGSEFIRCRFNGGTIGSLLGMQGSVVRHCSFGPFGPSTYAAVYVNGGFVENNLFTQCQPGATVLFAQADCYDSIRILGNTFIDNHGVIGQASCGIEMACSDTIAPCCTAIIEGNVVLNSSVNTEWGTKGLFIATDGRVRGNRFADLTPPEAVTIFSLGATALLRENVLERVGLAAEASETYGGPLDARWNWWGDSTGPYHWYQNPDGQGEIVGEHVLFEPWLTDTNAVPVAPRPEVPEQAELDLRVYPSPFNSQVTVVLLVPAFAREVEIMVYNVLGSEVYRNRVLAAGPALHFPLDASAWASGSYYVSARAGSLRAVRKVVLLK